MFLLEILILGSHILCNLLLENKMQISPNVPPLSFALNNHLSYVCCSNQIWQDQLHIFSPTFKSFNSLKWFSNGISGDPGPRCCKTTLRSAFLAATANAHWNWIGHFLHWGHSLKKTSSIKFYWLSYSNFNHL